MKVVHRNIIALAVFALAAAACGAPQSPEVRVEGIRIGGIGLRGGTLIARVLVTNPNSFDLETSSLTYNLQLANAQQAQQSQDSWMSFAEGTIDERVRVERRSSKVLEVPIQFRYDDVGGAIRALMETGTFNYRVTGNVRLSEPIGRTFPYQRTGTVSLDGVRE
jgi:LEA14-like dessication related protein